MVDHASGVPVDPLCCVHLERIVRPAGIISDRSTAGIPDIAHDLQTTNLIATLGVTTYVLGFAFGPLVWAPLSEVRGRRLVYLISWFVFTVFQIPCALAKNTGNSPACF
jgi:MFS family permease